MKILELLTEEKKQDTVIEMFEKFLPLAMEILKINSLPKMVFKPSLHISKQPSFGMYVNSENTLYVALKDRHPNDILRTVAHELVHFKQDINGELNDQSGLTGSPEENEANQVAGIIMRNFNKKYPDYLKSKPL